MERLVKINLAGAWVLLLFVTFNSAFAAQRSSGKPSACTLSQCLLVQTKYRGYSIEQARKWCPANLNTNGCVK